jgi:isopropylmalate/homocitrate/citramalate synthase
MKHDPKQPWLAEHWAASQHNFGPEIAIPPRAVAIHDITVRDGEECADLAFNVEDKVRVAEMLARLGVKRMEFFLTVPGWLEALRAIMGRGLGLDLYVTWQPGRVERALELGIRHIMVWYRIGEVYQQHVSRRSREELMDEMRQSVHAAKEAGAVVNLFLPESTRATMEHILAAARAAEQEGASSVTVVDSQGVARPAAITYLVRSLKQNTHLGVEVHCHNDFGLAVANVLAAYEGGGDALHVAANAVGYRAGNAALEEVVMALEVLYGVDTGLKLDLLPELSRLVEDITGLPSSMLKPIVGQGAFDYEQWGATAALTAGGARPYAFPFEPEAIGRSPRLMIGKWSDVGAVAKKLAEYGLAAQPEQLSRILLASQRAGVAQHRPLRDDEFLAIAQAEGVQPAE